MAEGSGSDGRPLAGQWAVVTGASKGIGRGIVDRLLHGGASVAMVARGQADLDAAVGHASIDLGADQSVFGVAADVSDRVSIDKLFAELRERVERLDIFVANAGTGHVTPFLELTETEFDAVVALNFTGTIHCMQRAAQMMAGQAVINGSIVVVSSIRAAGARPGRLIYSATKAGVNQAVRVAAAELAPMGIRVNALSPGITETPLTAANPAAFDEAVRNVPMGRAGQPADLAEGAYFLCSPASRFVTGINLTVDGGESLH